MTENAAWDPPSRDQADRAWHGALADPSSLNRAALAEGNRLADAARSGDWAAVFALLDRGMWDVSSWRPGGSSCFTPLHQAAWHGDGAAVRNLLSRGAWRSQTTADGRTAQDIAAQRGHNDLAQQLAPVALPGYVDVGVFTALDAQLGLLIESRTREFRAHSVRPPQSRVLTECGSDIRLWCAVPGMYGGFSIELRNSYLFVRSWSRMSDGSGQGHVVTAKDFTLVEEGFV